MGVGYIRPEEAVVMSKPGWLGASSCAVPCLTLQQCAARQLCSARGILALFLCGVWWLAMSAPWLCQLRLSTISIQPFCCYLCYVCPSTGLFWLTVWWGKCLWCFCVCLWNSESWVLNKTEHGRRLCILPVSVGYFSPVVRSSSEHWLFLQHVPKTSCCFVVLINRYVPVITFIQKVEVSKAQIYFIVSCLMFLESSTELVWYMICAQQLWWWKFQVNVMLPEPERQPREGSEYRICGNCNKIGLHTLQSGR